MFYFYFLISRSEIKGKSNVVVPKKKKINPKKEYYDKFLPGDEGYVGYIDNDFKVLIILFVILYSAG